MTTIERPTMACHEAWVVNSKRGWTFQNHRARSINHPAKPAIDAISPAIARRTRFQPRIGDGSLSEEPADDALGVVELGVVTLLIDRFHLRGSS
jgi:hypothetical protein